MAYVWMKNGKQFKNPLEYNNRKIINPSDTLLLSAGYQKVDIPTINEKTIVETRDQLPTPNQYYVGKTYLSIEDKGIYICAKEDNNYIWNKIPLSAENVLEVFSEFPTPSAIYLNKIYMYIGYSTPECQLGKLYTCIYNEDEHEYQWVEFASTETINTVSDIVCFPAVQTGVLLQWSDPVDNNWDKTVIVRKQGSAPSSPSDGTVVLTNTIRDQYKNNPYLDSGIDYTNYTWYYRWFTYSYGGIINDDEQSIKESILSWKTIKQLAENNNVDFRDYFNLGDNISTYNGIITNMPENAEPNDFYWHIADINQHNMRLLASRAYINSTTLTSGYSMLPYDIAQKSYISGVSTPWDNVGEFCIMPRVVMEEDWPELYKFNEIPFYLITTPSYQYEEMIFDKNRVWRTINTLYEIHFDVDWNTWVIYNTYTKQIEVNLSDTGDSPTHGIYNYSIFYTTEDNPYNDDLAKDHEEEYQTNAEIEIAGITYYRLFNDGYTVNHDEHPFDGSNYLIRNFITPSDGLTTYKNCAIDQYLNTSGNAGTYYQAQSPFSIARAWTNEKPGFMKEFDQDFIDGLADTTIEVIPGYYPLNNTHITRKFFIPSLKELNCTQTTLSSAADLDYPLQFYIDHPTNTYKIKQEYFSNPTAGYQTIRYYTRNSGYDNKIYRVIVNGNAATTPTVTNNTWIIPECTVGLSDDISRGLLYQSNILAAHATATISGDTNGIALYFECYSTPNINLDLTNDKSISTALGNLYIKQKPDRIIDEIQSLPFNTNICNTVLLIVYKNTCTIYVNNTKFTITNSEIPLTFNTQLTLSTNDNIYNVRVYNRDLSNFERQMLLPEKKNIISLLQNVVSINHERTNVI